MKLFAKFAFSIAMMAFVIGCGPAEGTKHKDDPTPGGEPTPAAGDPTKPGEGLMSNDAFDEYSKKAAETATSNPQPGSDAPTPGN